MCILSLLGSAVTHNISGYIYIYIDIVTSCYIPTYGVQNHGYNHGYTHGYTSTASRQVGNYEHCGCSIVLFILCRVIVENERVMHRMLKPGRPGEFHHWN